MAGKLWLWCGGLSELPEAAPPAEWAIWQQGAAVLSRSDAMLIWGSAAWPGSRKSDDNGREAGDSCRQTGENSGQERNVALDEEVEQGSPWVLNAGAATVASLSSDAVARRLELAGIRAGAAGEHGRLMRVVVFHLETVFIERLRASTWQSGSFGTGNNTIVRPWPGADSAGEAWQTPPAEPQDPDTKRASRLAKRAAYELLLDAAELLIRIGDSGKLYVEGLRLPGCKSFRPVGAGGLPPEAKRLPIVSAALWVPAMKRLALLLEQEATHLAERSSSVPPVRIGADPEFLILRQNGRIFSASQLGGLHSAVGSDMLIAGQSLRQPVGELRPEPATSAEELLSRIRRLLALAARRGAREPGMRLAAGAMPVPGIALGGHVHLSGVPLTTRLLRALDSYAAIPLALAEDAAGRGRRPRYGTFGDCRRQPHGGFEYRTLPSWLISPAVARYALGVALLAAEDSAWLDDLPSLEDSFARAYYEGDRETLILCLPRLRAGLRRAPSYEQRRHLLDPLLNAVESGAAWDESLDIRIRWGLPLSESSQSQRFGGFSIQHSSSHQRALAGDSSIFERD
ncbi:Phage phiEco32-like COOH.NH2 ligase-type 2 [Paenibacillaceae bacterium GAS479]|nr:Phage phiEco32-like COOH.NH2 ligase-type 2 [Paenibacillaceae bacterium GAS479]